MRVHESLRPNKSESEEVFKLFESAWELMRVRECLRPNESESGREFKLFESAGEFEAKREREFELSVTVALLCPGFII